MAKNKILNGPNQDVYINLYFEFAQSDKLQSFFYKNRNEIFSIFSRIFVCCYLVPSLNTIMLLLIHFYTTLAKNYTCWMRVRALGDKKST